MTPFPQAINHSATTTTTAATETQSAAPSPAAGQGCVHPDASVEQNVAILAIKGSHVAALAQRRGNLTQLSLFDRQWTPLVDSIAELYISKVQHEIVAIGLQASIKEESMVISIATNNDVPTLTTTHLRTLWRYLQDISAVFTSRGNPKGNASMNDRHRIPMKPDGEDIVAVHLRDFTRCKYSFSWDRFVRRFRKKWKGLSDLFTELELACFKDLYESIRYHFDVLFSALLAILVNP